MNRLLLAAFAALLAAGCDMDPVLPNGALDPSEEPLLAAGLPPTPRIILNDFEDDPDLCVTETIVRGRLFPASAFQELVYLDSEVLRVDSLGEDVLVPGPQRVVRASDGYFEFDLTSGSGGWWRFTARALTISGVEVKEVFEIGWELPWDLTTRPVTQTVVAGVGTAKVRVGFRGFVKGRACDMEVAFIIQDGLSSTVVRVPVDSMTGRAELEYPTTRMAIHKDRIVPFVLALGTSRSAPDVEVNWVDGRRPTCTAVRSGAVKTFSLTDDIGLGDIQITRFDNIAENQGSIAAALAALKGKTAGSVSITRLNNNMPALLEMDVFDGGGNLKQC